MLAHTELLREILDVHSMQLVLSHLEIVLAWIKEIFYFLFVNLDHGHLDGELDVGAGALYSAEDGAALARDDALILDIVDFWTKNRVRLA